MSKEFNLAFVDSVAVLVPKQDGDEIKRETWSCQSETQQKNLEAARNLANSFDQSVTSSDKRAEIIANEMIKQDLQRQEQQQQKIESKSLKPSVEEAKKFVLHGLKKKPDENFPAPLPQKSETKKVVHDSNFSSQEYVAHFANVGSVLSQGASMAIAAGGHQRTWNGVAKAGSSLLTFSSSLQTVQMAKTTLSLGFGYWGIVASAVSLAMSIFCNDEDDDADSLWRQEMRQAMQQIQSLIQEGFKRVESILIDVVCKKLNSICVKLERLETLMCSSFRDLHRKDLVDIVDAVENDFSGLFLLNNVERRNYLCRLTTWINCHSAATIEISRNRVDLENLDIFNELIDFNAPENSLHILIPLLSSLVPAYKPSIQIPNWELYLFTSKLFAVAYQKWKIQDPVYVLFDRIIEKLDQVRKAVELIDENVLACLHRQYYHQQFLLGRLLAEIKIDFGGEKTLQEKLQSVSAQERAKVQQFLQRFEILRRVIICCDRLIKPSSYFGFELIPGSAELLSSKTFRPNICGFLGKKVYNHDPWVTMKNGWCDELQEFLNQGLDVNLHDGWGNLLLRFLQSNQSNPKFLHCLLKCPGIDTSLGQRYKTDTWPVGSRPIQYILNCGQFTLAILFVANGYNIDSTNYDHWSTGIWGDMGNLYEWVKNAEHHDCIACMQLVSKMEDTNSYLYREKLRVAYSYYKEYESGQETVYRGSKEALLCIICLLGLIPHNFVLPKIDLDVPIVDCGLTWLMLASFSKNWNVGQFLLKQGNVKNLAVNWKGEKTSLSRPREPVLREESDFKKNIILERLDFANVGHLSRVNLQEAAKKQLEKREFFLDQMEKFVGHNAALQKQFQLCKNASQTDEFLQQLNLLNLLLKTLGKDYTIGTNVDIFIQFEMRICN